MPLHCIGLKSINKEVYIKTDEDQLKKRKTVIMIITNYNAHVQNVAPTIQKDVSV
jgi:hypothetical protein